MLSFRGTLRAEESLFLLIFKPREIPHFVRNDSHRHFSVTSEADALSHIAFPKTFDSLEDSFLRQWREFSSGDKRPDTIAFCDREK